MREKPIQGEPEAQKGALMAHLMKWKLGVHNKDKRKRGLPHT
jgi:hypothetical protein